MWYKEWKQNRDIQEKNEFLGIVLYKCLQQILGLFDHRFLGMFSYTCSTFDFCKEKYIQSGVLIMQQAINNLNSIIILLINIKNANLINWTQPFCFVENRTDANM